MARRSLPDIPKDVPIYTGADEAEASLLLNLFAQGTNNHLPAGRPPLRELQFEKDPGGGLEAVNDVFGDGSFFAILTPGHTTGHVSYLARTAQGPVLMTGDVSHTRWGWDNGVEPGTYLQEREPSIQEPARPEGAQRAPPADGRTTGPPGPDAAVGTEMTKAPYRGYTAGGLTSNLWTILGLNQ